MLREPDVLGDDDQVGEDVVLQMGELVHLHPGDHEHVARGDRFDGREGDAHVVRPHEGAGDRAVDDEGEHGAHAPIMPGGDGIGPGVDGGGATGMRCGRLRGMTGLLLR